jgi:3'(2'), 5'-bisphosphate nucleotidase
MDFPYYNIIYPALLEAAKSIVKSYNANIGFTSKKDNSPVTDADIESHKIIYDALESTNIPIVSEEGKLPDEKPSKYWCVDPLDGTKEFINKTDDFAINIALIENELPIFGYIYIPITEELYFGGKELGCFKSVNGSILSIKNITSNKEGALVSRNYLSPETKLHIKHKRTLNPNYITIPVGSSIKFCRLVDGLVNEYPRFSSIYEWDIASGQAIIEGAGGELLRLSDNSRMTYNLIDYKTHPFMAKINYGK